MGDPFPIINMTFKFSGILYPLLAIMLLCLVPGCRSLDQESFVATALGDKTMKAHVAHQRQMAEILSTNDQAFLMYQSTNSPDDGVRWAAFNKITDQALLENIVTNKAIRYASPQETYNRHLAAADRITDQEAIFRLLMATNLWDPKVAADAGTIKALKSHLTNQVLLSHLALIGAVPTPSQQAEASAHSFIPPEWPEVYPVIPSPSIRPFKLKIDAIQKVSCPGTLAYVMNSPIDHEIVNIDQNGLTAGLPDFLTKAEQEKALEVVMAGQIVFLLDPGLLANSRRFEGAELRACVNVRTLGFGDESGGKFVFNYKPLEDMRGEPYTASLIKLFGPVADKTKTTGIPAPQAAEQTLQTKRRETFLAAIKDQDPKARLQVVASLTDRNFLAQTRRYGILGYSQLGVDQLGHALQLVEIARLRLFLLEPMIQDRVGVTSVIIHRSLHSQDYYSQDYSLPVRKVTKHGETITVTVGGGYPDNQLEATWVTDFPQIDFNSTDHKSSDEYRPAKVDVASLIRSVWGHFTESERAQTALQASLRSEYLGVTAANSLTDPVLLRKVATEARNGDVRAAAQKRLEEIGGTAPNRP